MQMATAHHKGTRRTTDAPRWQLKVTDGHVFHGRCSLKASRDKENNCRQEFAFQEGQLYEVVLTEGRCATKTMGFIRRGRVPE